MDSLDQGTMRAWVMARTRCASRLRCTQICTLDCRAARCSRPSWRGTDRVAPPLHRETNLAVQLSSSLWLELEASWAEYPGHAGGCQSRLNGTTRTVCGFVGRSSVGLDGL